MTIICAAVGPDGTWLGSDRQRTFADRERFIGPGKWIVNASRSCAVAASGSGIAGNLLREHAEPLLNQNTPREFWRAFTEVLRANGCEPKADADRRFVDYDVGLLYAVPGMLFSISEVGEVLHCAEPWYARGCGDQYALGAMLALAGTNATTEERVRAGVWAACRYDIRCGGEAWVEKL